MDIYNCIIFMHDKIQRHKRRVAKKFSFSETEHIKVLDRSGNVAINNEGGHRK